MITALKNKIKSNIKLYTLVVNIVSILQIIFYSLFTWRGWFRNYVWFHIKAIGRVLKISCFYKGYEGIEPLKNSKKGKACFIIATGPSLKVEDVKKVVEFDTFGLNGIYKMFDKIDWNPNYYVSLDPEYTLNNYRTEQMNYDEFAVDNVFLNARVKKKIKCKKAVYFPASWLDHTIYYGSKQFIYSDNLLWGLYDVYSVTHSCMNIAQYMGYTEIYLLGVDNNYMGSKQHYGDTEEKNNLNPYTVKIQKVMTNGYKFMKKELSKRGVTVYNATRGGALEVFPRISLEEAVKRLNEE